MNNISYVLQNIIQFKNSKFNAKQAPCTAVILTMPPMTSHEVSSDHVYTALYIKVLSCNAQTKGSVNHKLNTIIRRT